MRHGFLLLGLGVVLLALFVAPARTAKADESHGAGANLEKAVEHETKQDEANVFKGFLDLSIWTIVVFLVLLFVLHRFAWKPMLEGLENRDKRIHDELDSAKKANEEAQTLKADFQRQLDSAHQKAREIMEEARKHAAEMTEDMVSKAKAEIQAERERLHREMDTAKDQALLELWQRNTQLASLLSSKAIRRQLTIEDQHRLVDEALADLGTAASDRQRVLASVA
jgi:F-type H+-transporting ATPase subunit b